MIGLGNPHARISVFTQNRPPIAPYKDMEDCRYFTQNEVFYIGQATGNHWRKVFNVYAKLLFEIDSNGYQTWQELRDQRLLQPECDHSLCFSKPSAIPGNDHVQIIMGKGYAQELSLAEQCQWLSPYIAINEASRTLISPYFDYRQLTNERIRQLAKLVNRLLK
ncbi:DUF6942 family protein [Thalassotalea ganghwensis]